MKIASVEVLAVGNELTGQHTLVRLETDGGSAVSASPRAGVTRAAWPACLTS